MFKIYHDISIKEKTRQLKHHLIQKDDRIPTIHIFSCSNQKNWIKYKSENIGIYTYEYLSNVGTYIANTIENKIKHVLIFEDLEDMSEHYKTSFLSLLSFAKVCDIDVVLILPKQKEKYKDLIDAIIEIDESNLLTYGG